MKNTFWLRICAILLSICTILSSVSAVQIIRAYAEEGDGDPFDFVDNFDGDEGDGEPVELPEGETQDPQAEQETNPTPDPTPTPPDSEPDPFDYDLSCYTPSISFGSVNADSIVSAKQFSIVNVGKNAFPLTWEEMDPSTAFDIGCISPSMDMNPGDSVSFSIAPHTNLSPGNYVASYTFFSANDYRRHHTARVDVSMTVIQNSPIIYAVTIDPGNVTLSPGKGYTFSATVYGDYDYDHSVSWSLTGNQSGSTAIDSNGNLYVSPNETASSFAVVATSRQDPTEFDRAVVSVTASDYVISVKAEPVEGGAVAGGGTVRAGGSTTISASPNNNYVFKGWFENGNQVASSNQVGVNNVTGDRVLVARFERQSCYVRTSVNNGDGGSVTGSATVAYGGNMTITAKANNGYYFAGFVENNNTISNSESIQLNNITTDRNIVAVFNRSTVNVNVSVNPSDTGKYEGAGTYNKGANVELKAAAYDGYVFTGWSVNGQVVSTDSTYRINNIQSDVNAVANFMKKNANTYKIVSGIASQGGSIVPSGDYVIAEGGSVTYNIAALADYKISAVVVDGKNIGPVASYTFNNVKGAHTITASFEKKPQQAASAANNTSGKNATKTTENKNAASSKKNTQKKTEYNTDTAAHGAVPEQKVVEVEVPEQIEELQGEEYEDDIITPATEIEDQADVPTIGVMAKHNMDEVTLRQLIDNDAVLPMLREAFEEGTLRITVNNSYAADKQETAVELYYANPSLTNFQDVIAESLTKEEKYAVLNGTPISFNVDITENTDVVDEGTKRLMQTKIGFKPVSYFDLLILKTSGGTTSVITNTASELEVNIPIPEKYRKKGRKFFVIRNHNGAVDVLKDIGDDPDSVTFRSDRFSEYAIAYEAININKLVLRVVIIAVISFLLAVICFVNLVKYKRSARRKM